MKAVDTANGCLVPAQVNGEEKHGSDNPIQAFKKPDTVSADRCEVVNHVAHSEKIKINGDTHISLNGNGLLNEESQSGMSKDYTINENLKSSFLSSNDETSQKSFGVDPSCNGKLDEGQHVKFPPAVHIRRKIQAVTDIFELKNGDDYVMIGMPNGKLSSFETGSLCSDKAYNRLLDDKKVNGNLSGPKVENEKSCTESDKHSIYQRLNGVSAESASKGDSSDTGSTVSDVICSSDVHNESNCKNKKVSTANGIVTNGEALPLNGCGEDSRSEGSDEVDRGELANWDRTVTEVKEQVIARLQDELHRAHQELKLRDEEVNRLSRIRQEVEGELEELTASLFQEAHNMVRTANVKQAAAERSLKESQMQVDVLMAEVAALKTLVLTSTPSRPNPHLHPQIDPRASRSKDDSSPTGVSLFNKKHRRSPSHFNLKYGRENSPPESPVKEQQTPVPDLYENKDGWEVDPILHKEFVAWKNNPKIDKSDPFIARIYNEDINLCLEFQNAELGAKVRESVEEGTIFIEAVSDKSKTMFPKKCALLETPRQCHYRMKLGDQEQWHYISQICRNRIIAVCDFLNYLRYIERGLVKSSVHDIYWEITRLRKEMVLARLGLALSS